MKKGLFVFLAAAVLCVPSLCLAQSSASTPDAMQPFLGTWSGPYEECSAPGNCESRSARMTVSADKVEYTLGPSSGAMGRHSKSGSAPRSFTYPIKAENVQGSPGFSFTTKSGTKVVFSMSGGKLVGQGSGGRFNVRYSLTKGGN